jgi:iron complex outermembrane receptor protein
MKKFIYAAAVALMPCFGFAQLSGTVVDTASNETIAGAVITIENSFLTTITDVEGKFSFDNIKQPSVTIRITHLGYEAKTQKIPLPAEKIDIVLNRKTYLTDEVIVTATRASDDSPTAFTNIEKKTIEEKNLGQDLPFLLSTTPSVIVTSDAGNAVGYTGIRIRGSDAGRVNVTINGIPVNDAESHNVYWVDLPDFASSVENIQIQRGIGTSTNGAGAFGGSVNIQSHSLSATPFAEINSSAGSFNTFKNTVNFGTGLLKQHFAVEGRLSKITSDGFIDRATSDLKSFYLSSGYYDSRSSLRLIIFSGHEKTYQAWNGVPEEKVKGINLTDYYNNHIGSLFYTAQDSINWFTSNGRTYNYYTYDNQTDNYQQDYYQLHWSYAASETIDVNAALHYTKGKGYYEEFKNTDDYYGDGTLSSYGMPDLIIGADTITQTDLIRQLWLDNDFYGMTFSANYDKGALRLTLGGAANTYEGSHFDEVTWAQFYTAAEFPFVYNDNHATKNDVNAFAKGIYSVSSKLHLFADVQQRAVSYSFYGFKDALDHAQNEVSLTFFNPKGGATFDINSKHKVYASVAKAGKEPTRNDYVDSPPYAFPKPEKMTDVEAGYKFSGNKLRFCLNYYLMNYKDQLILTGKLNDVGEYTRINVPNSYRTGVEVEVAWAPLKNLSLSGNVTVSNNKIKQFDEYIDNWDSGGQALVVHKNTDIAFSPSLTSSFILSYSLFKHITFEDVMRYVGEQFLDNTSNRDRMLDGYLTDDIYLSYHISTKDIKDIALKLVLYNIGNELYSSNGWTYPYIYGGTIVRENSVYPQAGTNWMAGICLKF